jgi:hypothetical protein
MNGTSRSIACAAGSRRFSEPESAATAFVECDGEVSPKAAVQVHLTAIAYNLKRTMNILAAAA